MPTPAAHDRDDPGPAEAFEQVFHEHSGRCLAHARAVLRDRHMAEDAVQEAFVEHWRHPARWDPAQSTLAGWLLMLTHRRAVDRVRAERRRAASSLDLVVDLPDAAPSPFEEALSGVESSRAREALALLPQVQRELLVLAYWGGHTQSQIAALTGTPLGTVKTRTRRALRELAEVLADVRV